MNITHSLAAFFFLGITLSHGADSAPKPIDYQGNLSKVPATDPAATNPPAIVPGLKGIHPRLLFTAQEIATLKSRIATDPILKKSYEDTIAWAKRGSAPKERPPQIVMGDTPALATANGAYPALAYAYALDKDPAVLKAISDILTMMVEQPYWADTAELDSNMGAACNMLMVALLYDAAYNELDPALRTKVTEKLLIHARRLYYLGHMELGLMPIKYWQQDPQPNHRWYRARGLAAAVTAITDEPGIETGWLRQKLKEEMDFLSKWYPHDGDCHEGAGYQSFGFRSLADAASIMDRNLGTTYLKSPGFENAWAQQVYYWVPGRGSNMGFGDDMNSIRTFGYDDAAFFVSPHLSRDKDVQAALVRRFQKMAVGKADRPYLYPWSLLAYYDPTVGEGDYKSLPLQRLFADLGAATMRDSWEDHSVIFAFKCGPYGGYGLNKYRETVLGKDGKPHYVNVAHDDPDANTFALSVDGDFLFHPGLYSFRKITSTQNGVIIDGKGQIGEGSDFTQPVSGVDMRTLSYLTGWKTGDKGRIIVEGEAGKTYPDLTGFRRSAIWMPSDYILLLDNITSAGPHEITWHGVAEKAQFDDPENGKGHTYTEKGTRLDFQMLANKPFNGAIDFVFLDGRFGGALMQQLQFSLKSDTVKFACLMDPWKKKPEMTLVEKDGAMVITVKGSNYTDTWTCFPAKDALTPSRIEGKRDGSPLISLNETDKAPHGE